jgi:hypothetical protein
MLNPLSMVFWTPYPWYMEPAIHVISNPISMVYWTTYPRYFDPPTHVI